MTEKLSWEDIEKLHDQEWVELVDYEWDLSEPNPQKGVVRAHAKSRKELSDFIKSHPQVDSAILFVGNTDAPSDLRFNANLWQVR